MNPEQAEEWRLLRSEQNALRARLDALEQRQARFEAMETPAPSLAPPVPAQPPPLPPMPPMPAAPPAAPGPATPVPRGSVEAKIGSEWTVRAGVVSLLAALVFGATYLYQNVVPHLGPASKVGLLYTGAGLLAGLGAWLERSRAGHENPRVRNYARIVLAGGLAAVYYVTYAAHYYPNLRVIGNPLLAGLLLIGWAGFIVWLADRRGSQTLASFAILLAFYTSAVNEIAGFTLVSNLPLAVAAVFLLRRHLWRIFPFASLLATYGSYGYWRYFHSYTELMGLAAVRRYHIVGDFWTQAVFLSIYWLLFTWAVFSTPERTLPTARRAGFASLNNGAFFLLVTWSLLEDYPWAFWKWALGFGVVLVALAETCRRLPQRTDRETENAFLLGGSLLVTVGCIAYFSGWQLSMVMAVQSVLLLAAAQRRANRWLLIGSMATAVTAFALAIQELGEPDTGHFQILALAVGIILVFGSWLGARSPAAEFPAPLVATVGGIYEGLAVGLALAWGEKYFPQMAKFSLFGMAGGVLFAFGIVTRWRRWAGWSYVLTCAGLFSFWLDYSLDDHRMPIHLLGIGCLAAQQQFQRKYDRSDLAATWCPPSVQAALIVAAVLAAWSAWSAAVIHWNGGGIGLAGGWSFFAAAMFVAGLALRERVYRWMALLILVATLGHVLLIDIWQLDSLARFFSLLCLGIVLLAIGFFYTRFQSKIRDLF